MSKLKSPEGKKSSWRKFKFYSKKFYRFVFYDDSLLSWIVNILLAFLLVKFLIYPGLALALGSELPLVAVISGSMEHEGLEYEQWWDQNEEWYLENDITNGDFQEYKFVNGFDKGDVIILGAYDDAEVGDVLVYSSTNHPYPIIHRVTYINEEDLTYELKGDNNDVGDPDLVENEQLIGKALYRIPYIGWVKIWFAELFGL